MARRAKHIRAFDKSKKLFHKKTLHEFFFEWEKNGLNKSPAFYWKFSPIF